MTRVPITQRQGRLVPTLRLTLFVVTVVVPPAPLGAALTGTAVRAARTEATHRAVAVRRAYTCSSGTGGQ